MGNLSRRLNFTQENGVVGVGDILQLECHIVSSGHDVLGVRIPPSLGYGIMVVQMHDNILVVFIYTPYPKFLYSNRVPWLPGEIFQIMEISLRLQLLFNLIYPFVGGIGGERCFDV